MFFSGHSLSGSVFEHVVSDVCHVSTKTGHGFCQKSKSGNLATWLWNGIYKFEQGESKIRSFPELILIFNHLLIYCCFYFVSSTFDDRTFHVKMPFDFPIILFGLILLELFVNFLSGLIQNFLLFASNNLLQIYLNWPPDVLICNFCFQETNW